MVNTPARRLATAFPSSSSARQSANTTGASGEYVKGRIDLQLAERHRIDPGVLVLDLGEASKGSARALTAAWVRTFGGSFFRANRRPGGMVELEQTQ